MFKANMCPECSAPLEHHNDGRICGKCGLVVDDGYYSGNILLV